MLSYTLRRVLLTLPVMLFVALFVFGLLSLTPGDPAVLLAGEDATPADIARIRMTLGLDQPFLLRFGDWIWKVLHGDLGVSLFTGLQVSQMIGQRLAPTFTLMIMTLILSVTLAVPLGALAAWHIFINNPIFYQAFKNNGIWLAFFLLIATPLG
ncbi:MAG: ABC transporter permease, partial [Alcaligenaceae bacterium]